MPRMPSPETYAVGRILFFKQGSRIVAGNIGSNGSCHVELQDGSYTVDNKKW